VAVRAIADSHGVPEVWIGGIDLNQEGRWQWADGTHFAQGSVAIGKYTYVNWAQGEPNNDGTPQVGPGLGGQDCIQMYGEGARHHYGANWRELGYARWDDLACSERLPSICELTAVAPDTNCPGICKLFIAKLMAKNKSTDKACKKAKCEKCAVCIASPPQVMAAL